MATSVKERCGQIFGNQEGADYFMAIAQAGKNEGEETLYSFGAYFNLPTSVSGLPEGAVKKYAILGVKRMVSVSQAPFRSKIEAGELDAAGVQAWFEEYNGDGLDVVLDKAPEKREAKITGVTPLVQCARDLYEVGQLNRLVKSGQLESALNVPKDLLKEIRAKARQAQKDNSAGWKLCIENAPKELEARMKKAQKTEDMPD